MQSRCCPTFSEQFRVVFGAFGRFRLVFGAFGRFRAVSGCFGAVWGFARNCPEAPERARAHPT
eukprot:8069409-Alexandrium_andersonii.AAC.1